ncbi:hypothetical protein ACFFKE_22260 [Streptomyces mutabilis]|uniref:hypothetical protein n=1 Tax=Streptomyces mutabilis TaxID=67332 RepID=UPI001E5AA3B9|nr:hypothetical protein [Streptomyces mutabilis]
MISSKRSVDELPGDPRRLNLEYRSWHFVSSAGDRNGFDEWHVSVWSNRFLDRPKWSATETVQDDIGSMRLFRMRMDDRFSPFPFADAESHERACPTWSSASTTWAGAATARSSGTP